MKVHVIMVAAWPLGKSVTLQHCMEKYSVLYKTDVTSNTTWACTE